MDADARRTRARLAAFARHRQGDPETIAAAECFRGERYTEHVRTILETVPPLTPQQRTRLTALLTDAVRTQSEQDRDSAPAQPSPTTSTSRIDRGTDPACSGVDVNDVAESARSPCQSEESGLLDFRAAQEGVPPPAATEKPQLAARLGGAVP